MTKNVLITGCSSGLGLSLAVAAAKAGFTVYATMRDIGKRGALDDAAKAAGVSLHVRQLDVEHAASIDAVVDEIVKAHGRIDILVNNAGAGFVGTTELTKEEDIRWAFEVNFHGVVRCVKAVLPHMREARAGHIINITSVGGLVGQPFNEIYCAAKFAVEGYTEALASYVGPAFGIHFTAVEPGGIKSAFAGSALAKLASGGGVDHPEYKVILDKYIGYAQARAAEAENDTSKSIYQTSDEVAAVVLACMQRPSPPLRVRTSAWAEDLCDLKTSADPDGKKLQAKVVDMFLGGMDAVKR